MSSKYIGLPSKVTGLPFVVWLIPKHAEDEHPRIALTPYPQWDDEDAVLCVLHHSVQWAGGDLPDQDAAYFSEWVMYNRQVINDFWSGRIDAAKTRAMITKVEIVPHDVAAIVINTVSDRQTARFYWMVRDPSGGIAGSAPSIEGARAASLKEAEERNPILAEVA